MTDDSGRASSYHLPVVPRYAETDQQGVVFNGHYLTWFDEACTGYFDHLHDTGAAPSYAALIASGRNVYVVVSTQDWAKRPVPDALRAALTDA